MNICVSPSLRLQFRACAMALAALLVYSTAATAQTSLWTDLPAQSGATTRSAPQRGDEEPTSRQVGLNLTGMIAHLAQAPSEISRGTAGTAGAEIQVDLPHPDGGFETFSVYATSVMSPELVLPGSFSINLKVAL